MTLSCLCGKQFYRPPSQIKKRNFCSKQCHDAAQVKRVDKQCTVCGKIFQVRPCERQKYATCQSSSCRKKIKVGKNNPKWKGGKTKKSHRIRSSKKYKEWRKAVFERDNYTCVFCGQQGGQLNADHVLPFAYFPDRRFDISNGRTLCINCHRKTYKENLEWEPVKRNEYIANVLLGKEDLKWIGCDLDDTLAEKIWPKEGIGKELPGAISSMLELQKEGWKICIFTAKPWADYIAIEKWCKDHGFVPDKIICGKPLFKVMIDDSGYRFSGDWKKDMPGLRDLLHEQRASA